MLVEILDKESGESYGTISEEELQVLLDVLEEEDSHDHDYWIDAATIELLETEEAPEELLDVLRRALGSQEGVELIWERVAAA